MVDFNKINVSIDPQDIKYSVAEFSMITVREIYKGGYATGTYHIKPNENINVGFLFKFLKKEIPSGVIELADPEFEINLEYPIYMASKTSRIKIIQEMQSADKSLGEFIKNRKMGKNREK